MWFRSNVNNYLLVSETRKSPRSWNWWQNITNVWIFSKIQSKLKRSTPLQFWLYEWLWVPDRCHQENNVFVVVVFSIHSLHAEKGRASGFQGCMKGSMSWIMQTNLLLKKNSERIKMLFLFLQSYATLRTQNWIF